MADVDIRHRPALEAMASVIAGWDLWCLLLKEDSSATPVVGDQTVASLTPGSNECDHTGYERMELTTIAAAWHSGSGTVRVTADNLNFGALASESSGQGVGAVVIYRKVSASDDSLNTLVRTVVLDTPKVFNGSDVIVGFDATGAIYVDQS